MSPSRQHALRHFLGFVCLLILVTAALVMLGWSPTRRLAGEGGIPAMLAGAGASLLASMIGGLPIVLGELRHGAIAIRETLASLAVRFFVVLGGALYVLLLAWVDREPFLVWLGISYLALLPVDVRYMMRAGPRGGARGT